MGLETVEPCEGTDQAAATDIAADPVMPVKKEFIRGEGTSFGSRPCDELRSIRIPEREVSAFDAAEPEEFRTVPDDLRDGIGCNNSAGKIVDEILKGIEFIEFSGGTQCVFKMLGDPICFGGMFGRRRGDLPFTTKQRVAAGRHAVPDIPVFFFQFQGKFTEFPG